MRRRSPIRLALHSLHALHAAQVSNKVGADSFSEDDAALLGGIGALLSVAIVNATLYHDATEAKRLSQVGLSPLVCHR